MGGPPPAAIAAGPRRRKARRARWGARPLEEFIRGGHAVDLALGLIVIEAIALWLLKRRGKGPGLGALAPFLVAGAALLLGLRAALWGAPWICVAGALAISGAAHLVDLRRRFRA